jgi:hypothetical protein
MNQDQLAPLFFPSSGKKEIAFCFTLATLRTFPLLTMFSPTMAVVPLVTMNLRRRWGREMEAKHQNNRGCLMETAAMATWTVTLDAADSGMQTGRLQSGPAQGLPGLRTPTRPHLLGLVGQRTGPPPHPISAPSPKGHHQRFFSSKAGFQKGVL